MTTLKYNELLNEMSQDKRLAARHYRLLSYCIPNADTEITAPDMMNQLDWKRQFANMTINDLIEFGYLEKYGQIPGSKTLTYMISKKYFQTV